MKILRRSLPVVIACAALAGCGREDEPVTPPETEAVRLYGYGPQPSPRVRYQPDVILMPQGPEIIRGLSEDGITWILDADAQRVDDLAPGKIMFASGRAVGRVIEVQRRGRDVAVTVLPVELTEVIRDANLKFETTLETRPTIDAATEDAATEDLSTSEQHLSEDQPRLVFASWQGGDVRFQRVGSDEETESDSYSVTNPLGSFEVQPFVKLKGSKSSTKMSSIREIGVKISKKSEGTGGLKLGASVSLYGSSVRVRANLVIVDGEVKDASSFVIEGIEGLNVGFASGSEKAMVVKGRLEDSWIDTGKNIPIEGVPMAVTFKMKAYAELAFSAGNSTIWASGRYKLTGPMGYANGEFQKPTLTVEKPMMQSISGVVIGPVGIIAAVETRILFGIGHTEAAVAGYYGKIIVSAGVSRGSALGLPIADCHGITLKIDYGRGWGIDFNKKISTLLLGRKLPPFAARLRKQLADKKFEIDYGEEGTLFKRTSVEPDIPLCGGGPEAAPAA